MSHMRSLLALLILLCLSASVGIAQQRTTTKKPSTAPTRKPTTTPTRKPAATATRPAAVTAQSDMTETTTTQPASLTFPSTEPDVAPTDPVKQQQLYDELHGNKNRPAAPDMKDNRRAKRAKDADAGRSGRNAEETASRGSNRSSRSGEEAGTYIGVKAGGNYATYLSNVTVPDGLGGTINLGKPDPTYGFHAGVVFQFGKGGIAFQPEILFNQDYVKTPDLLTGNTTTVSVSSLLVPLLAKFQFGQQGATRFFVNVGPYGQYGLNDNNDSVIGYGGALGLGVGIPAGSGKVTVEARGYYSLGSTARGDSFGARPGNPILAQLSVGYLFPLGSR